MKTWMQELVVRSKTRKSIVQTVTSQDKFQSPKIKKLKIQWDSFFKTRLSFCYVPGLLIVFYSRYGQFNGCSVF